jgi:hypothetical protein
MEQSKLRDRTAKNIFHEKVLDGSRLILYTSDSRVTTIAHCGGKSNVDE